MKPLYGADRGHMRDRQIYDGCVRLLKDLADAEEDISMLYNTRYIIRDLFFPGKTIDDREVEEKKRELGVTEEFIQLGVPYE